MPAHVPGVPVSVDPRCALPVTTGRTVLTGAALGTVAVAVLAAVSVPSGLAAVTTTRTVAPTSSAVRVYVGPVASGMFVRVALPLVGVDVAVAGPRALAGGQGGGALDGARDRRPGRVDRRRAGDLGRRGADGGGAAVRVGDGHAQAQVAADVVDGDRVRGARRTGDVGPGHAVRRGLPLVAVGVADPAPATGRTGQRQPALSGAADGRRRLVEGAGGQHGRGRLAGLDDRRVGVGGGDEHAHRRVHVGDGQRVGRAGRAGDVDVALAEVALPLVARTCCPARSRCRAWRTASGSAAACR